MTTLLEQVGCRPRGNRHDCSQCGGRRTVTHTAELFYCHRCGWKGNTITLARELDIEREWLPRRDYVRQLRQKRRANAMAHFMYSRLRGRRLELLDELHAYNRLELKAHHAGQDHPATWGALALVYREQPRIEAELDFLERATAQELIQSLA